VLAERLVRGNEGGEQDTVTLFSSALISLLRSVTLVGEADRKMLKAAIKRSSGEDQVRHRVIPAEAIQAYVERLAGLNGEIAEILKEEKEEKHLRKAEMELKKGQNMIEHEAEIYSRPARTWFQSGKEKEKAKELSKRLHDNGGKANKVVDDTKPKRDKFSGLSRKAKRRKMITAEDEELGDQKSLNASIRSAKKAARPAKIGVPERGGLHTAKKKNKSSTKEPRGGGSFESDLSQKSQPREGIRARRDDAVKVGNKGGGNKTKKKGRK